MTIAYCRQVLRMNPSKVVFLNIKDEMAMPASPIVPVAQAKYPADLVTFDDILKEYVAPLAAIVHIRELSGSNLLPETFRDMVVQRKVMVYCILVLALLSLIGLAYIGFQSVEIIRSRAVISSLRSDIGKRQAIIGEFEGARGDF